MAADQDRVRIVPKVFADVPSAAELSAARSGRTSLVVLSVLLLGMLIPSAGGAYFLFNENKELTDKITAQDVKTKELTDTIAQRDASVTTLKKENEDAIAEYLTIATRREETRKLREDIKKLLEGEKKGAEVVRRPPLGSPNSRTAYEGSQWPVLKDGAEQQLLKEKTELEAILKDVQDWAPRGSSSSPFPG